MYCTTGSCSGDTVPELLDTLDNLKSRVRTQSVHNRSLLADRMANIRTQISILRNNPLAVNARRSMSHTAGAASMIDIRG